MFDRLDTQHSENESKRDNQQQQLQQNNQHHHNQEFLHNTITLTEKTSKSIQQASLNSTNQEQQQHQQALKQKETVAFRKYVSEIEQLYLTFEAEKYSHSPRFDDLYKFKAILGRGAFGQVVSAVQRTDGQPVAIKIIDKKQFKKFEGQLDKEAKILQHLDHPNIIKFFASHESSKCFMIVMEYFEGISLDQFIETRLQQPFSDKEARYIIKQVLLAISHMHSQEILHRDLKPENILIRARSEGEFEIRVIDFGLSFKNEQIGTLSDNCGTLIYMAPEVAFNRQYQRSVDLWSCGIIQFMLFSMGKHPLWEKADTRSTFLEKLKNPQWKFPANMRVEAKQFFLKTAATVAEDRMNAQQCLKHVWISGEGKVSDPVTMNDMIACFSKTQLFSQVLKATMFLQLLKRKCDSTVSRIDITARSQLESNENLSEDSGSIYGFNMSQQQQQQQQSKVGGIQFRQSFQDRCDSSHQIRCSYGSIRSRDNLDDQSQQQQPQLQQLQLRKNMSEANLNTRSAASSINSSSYASTANNNNNNKQSFYQLRQQSSQRRLLETPTSTSSKRAIDGTSILNNSNNQNSLQLSSPQLVSSEKVLLSSSEDSQKYGINSKTINQLGKIQGLIDEDVISEEATPLADTPLPQRNSLNNPTTGSHISNFNIESRCNTRASSQLSRNKYDSNSTINASSGITAVSNGAVNSLGIPKTITYGHVRGAKSQITLPTQSLRNVFPYPPEITGNNNNNYDRTLESNPTQSLSISQQASQQQVQSIQPQSTTNKPLQTFSIVTQEQQMYNRQPILDTLKAKMTSGRKSGSQQQQSFISQQSSTKQQQQNQLFQSNNNNIAATFQAQGQLFPKRRLDSSSGGEKFSLGLDLNSQFETGGDAELPVPPPLRSSLSNKQKPQLHEYSSNLTSSNGPPLKLPPILNGSIMQQHKKKNSCNLAGSGSDYSNTNSPNSSHSDSLSHSGPKTPFQTQLNDSKQSGKGGDGTASTAGHTPALKSHFYVNQKKLKMQEFIN